MGSALPTRDVCTLEVDGDMQVIPAIDIRGGRCARLFKGDYERETVFDNDPVAAARRWIGMGAQRLHVIDLDGAKDGVRVNADTVRRIAGAVDVPIQMGGGVRTADDAAAVADMGVEMVIFGTAAVENPTAVRASVDALGAARVCVSVDARDGMVRTRGWLADTSIAAQDLMRDMADECGVRNFIYTDTTRDGTLAHPNFASVRAIVGGVDHPVMIAGGIASVDDIRQLRDLGAVGAITGMAIYTGALDLAAAIRAVSPDAVDVGVDDDDRGHIERLA